MTSSISATPASSYTVDILRGLFCVILVSTVLTVYEVYLFYTNVVPTIRDAVNGGTDDLANQLNQKLDITPLCLMKSHIISVYKTLQDQENEYVSTINTYTKATACVLMIVLVGALTVIRYFVNQLDPINGLMGYTWVVGIITVALIMLFQWYFYYYGRSYKYLSGVGKEELLYHLGERL